MIHNTECISKQVELTWLKAHDLVKAVKSWGEMGRWLERFGGGRKHLPRQRLDDSLSEGVKRFDGLTNLSFPDKYGDIKCLN